MEKTTFGPDGKAMKEMTAAEIAEYWQNVWSRAEYESLKIQVDACRKAASKTVAPAP